MGICRSPQKIIESSKCKKYMVCKSQIHKLPHLLKVRKSEKIKSANLRNLFADSPTLENLIHLIFNWRNNFRVELILKWKFCDGYTILGNCLCVEKLSLVQLSTVHVESADQGGGIHGGALRAEHGTISGWCSVVYIWKDLCREGFVFLPCNN
jgi:hypothetical protein